ncbi:hypothetical protein FUA23_16020 [Neolewinella aurantiaca]|uniref:Uncharacterized protein n=1 Tax=Neolewinella aurantiaca TaxID=2602767 RepID=A0A5C7FTJ8_9BACT|nr:hypothetical protein [Neolewinella aurantiaca]TXF88146.1 hypothetical protein FUA23_16020 [Neolewinella aurantiaca]
MVRIPRHLDKIVLVSLTTVVFCTLTAEYDLSWYGDPVRPGRGFPFPFIKDGSWTSMSFELAPLWLIADFLIYLGLSFLLLRRLSSFISSRWYLAIPLLVIAAILVLTCIFILTGFETILSLFDYQPQWQTIRFKFFWL